MAFKIIIWASVTPFFIWMACQMEDNLQLVELQAEQVYEKVPYTMKQNTFIQKLT